MRKKKILLINLLLLTSLVLCSITNTAYYPSGEITYSDQIVAGRSFKWEVKDLESAGEEYSYFGDYMYIGEIQLAQGDIIEVKVLKDPDESDPGEPWYNLYVAGINVTDPTYIEFGYLWYFMMYFMWYFTMGGMFFISPVDYTNTTGTYNIFETLYEQLEDFGYSEEEHEYSSSGGVTYTYDYIYRMEVALSADIFSFELYVYEYDLEQGPGTDRDLNFLEATIRFAIDIKTGLLEEYKNWIDYEFFERVEGVIEDDEKGYFHFLIKQKGLGAPYNWNYSVLGLIIIAVVIVLKRRKK